MIVGGSFLSITLVVHLQPAPSPWLQPAATLLGASITALIALTVGILAYIFGKRQKEHEVRFTQLYEQTAEVVAELYSSINKISNRFENWYDYHRTAKWAQREQTYALLEQSIKDFHAYYLEKDIWINSESLRNKIQEFYDETNSKRLNLDKPLTEEELGREAEKVVKWVNTRRKELRGELESEFRRVLGITVESRRNAIVRGWWRIMVGLVGTILIGGVVGYVISLILSGYLERIEGTALGVLMGLGVGLLMEYVYPSQQQKAVSESSKS